jgi:type 1 glutamine amidotransferase
MRIYLISTLIALCCFTTSLLAADAPAQAPSSPKKVLVFSMTVGFHHSSIPTGHKVLTEIGQKSGAFTAVVSDDLSNFNPDKIKDFDAIIFCNSTSTHNDDLPFNDEQKKAFIDFVKGGKAFIGIHSATDTFYKWDDYGDMIGAHFDGHPWTSDVTVGYKVEKHNAITAPWPDNFSLVEETYQMGPPYDRSKLNVLISIDTAKTDMKRPGIKRTDGDFAVAWTKPYGKGRVFYTSLGHNEAVWNDPRYQAHLLAGIEWAMGKGDATPAATTTQPAATAKQP